MKIIDLLNKIANDEKIPKKIIGKNSSGEKEEYVYNDFWYIHIFENSNGEEDYYYMNKDICNLNDEVEIIEEETKPLTKQDVEALGYACGEIRKCFENGWNKSLGNKPFKEDKKIEKLKPELLKLRDEDEHWEYVDFLRINVQFLAEKVNEIIDILNKEE